MTVKRYIGVIGSGEGVTQEVLDDAEEVGRQIALAGAILVCGGRLGVMEAACRGAKLADGLTVGILPDYSRDGANQYVDVSIPTGLGYSLRNFITVRSSDAIIMLHGEIGTLSEVVLAYQHGKPVIALEKTGGWAERLKKTAMDDGAYLDTRHLVELQYATSPAEAVKAAFNLIGKFPTPVKL